jgi:ParB family chromosome partitioning protein
MRMLKLPKSVLDMVRDGQLSFGHARALLTLDDPLQAAQEIAKKHLSVRQTEELVTRLGHGAKEVRPRDKGMASEVEALAKNLSEKLGMRVQIKFNGKGGAVILHYADLDQMDSLLALLNG